MILFHFLTNFTLFLRCTLIILNKTNIFSKKIQNSLFLEKTFYTVLG